MSGFLLKSSHAVLALLLILVATKEECKAQAQLFRLAKVTGSESRNAVRETLLEVWINGRSTGNTVLLVEKKGKFFAQKHDLERWRLKDGGGRNLTHRGQVYVPLDAIDGLSYSVDPHTMQLQIAARPRAFVPTHLTGRRTLVSAAKSDIGGFFNYDLFYQGQSSYHGFSGLGEIGFFGSGGLLLGNFAYRSENEAELVRLETAYRYDWPDHFWTLTAGDGISRGATQWGNALHFGGIQWGTNFRLQPTFVTTPLLSFEGEAVLPSTVDLYINDTLQMHNSVPPGPFTIDHTPILSGLGEARIVITDLLGREQVVTGAFYATPKLLGRGLDDYTVQTGYIRKHFGITSNDYGDFFASGIYRRGITDAFTAELSTEYTEKMQTVGASGAWLFEEVGVFSTSTAVSQRDGEHGATGVVGFDRAQNNMSFGGTVRGSTRDFVQLGSAYLPARLDEHFYAGYGVRKLGYFNVDFTHRDYRDRDDIAIAGISYHRTWRGIGTLSASVFRTLLPRDETTFSVYFTTSLGERRSGSVGYTEDAGGGHETVRFRQHLPMGPGYGYALSADFGTYERLEALLELQTDYGTYSAGASHMQNSDIYRATANGGIALMGGEWFLSRRINESFAVVDTGALAGVTILKDNQPVGTTGADGKLLVPSLRAYETNPIGIEEQDLPLEAALPTLSQDAVPAYRSGVVVSFPLSRVRRALLDVVLEDGTPVPAGAYARIEGQDERFPVGRGGRLYLEGLGMTNRIGIRWNGSGCEFTLDYPSGDDPLPTLGTFTCKGATQ